MDHCHSVPQELASEEQVDPDVHGSLREKLRKKQTFILLMFVCVRVYPLIHSIAPPFYNVRMRGTYRACASDSQTEVSPTDHRKLDPDRKGQFFCSKLCRSRRVRPARLLLWVSMTPGDAHDALRLLDNFSTSTLYFRS